VRRVAVDRNPVPCMGAEDFAFMLQKKPGSYVR
jgi:metal-dependent amidase/aminoacylase/carboxypeptidase family protein